MKLNGPGKYDTECHVVMSATDAAGVFMIVIKGDKGTGVSFVMNNPALMRAMPDVLERIAAEIRADLQEGTH